MTKDFYKIPKDQFVDLVINKFRAYALVDIENKIQQLSLAEFKDENLYGRISELQKERVCYEKASKSELLSNLLELAKERFLEEEMSYAKAAFDLTLSKRKFSSYH